MENQNEIKIINNRIVIEDPAKRYEICKSCDKFFKPTRQCRECMCFMTVKTKVHEANCPLGKW